MKDVPGFIGGSRCIVRQRRRRIVHDDVTDERMRRSGSLEIKHSPSTALINMTTLTVRVMTMAGELAGRQPTERNTTNPAFFPAGDAFLDCFSLGLSTADVWPESDPLQRRVRLMAVEDVEQHAPERGALLR